MSTTFSIVGHFANGQTRQAGIHCPGNAFKDSSGKYHPEFTQRVMRFLDVFKSEFEKAPTLPNGVPKFEYIDFSSHIMPNESRIPATVEKGYFALTPRALKKCMQKTNFDVPYSELRKEQGFNYGSVGRPAVTVNMTNYPKGDVFWVNFKHQINANLQRLFGIGFLK